MVDFYLDKDKKVICLEKYLENHFENLGVELVLDDDEFMAEHSIIFVNLDDIDDLFLNEELLLEWSAEDSDDE